MVKVIPTTDGTKLFSGNKVVGYVENDTLYGFDRQGYAVEIGPVEQHTIVAKYNEWSNKRYRG